MHELLRMGIGALRREVERGAAAPGDPARASLERIEELAHLNAFVEARDDPVAEAAAASGPLAGVPVAVKDMLVDRDRIPTCGSGAHGTWLSGTATVVQRLRDAGAAIVGYSNLHEWGVGMTSAVTRTGPILNPWHETLVTGGSSGGSAAALAAGMVAGAVGTDAGGSIRCPSACCGVTGLKPAAGRIPTEGFVGHGGSIDGVGPMARSVEDVATLFSVMTGEEVVLGDAGSLRLGVARSFFFDDVDPAVGAAAEAAVETLARIVAEVRDVELPSAPAASFGVPGLLLPLFFERLADVVAERPDAFQPATLFLLELGRGMTDADVEEARALQRTVAADWARVFEEVDVVVTPTLPGPPAPQDTLMLELPSGQMSPELAYLRTNAPMNLGGVAGLSLPCGEIGPGLTTNVTLTAPREEVALTLGRAFERATDEAFVNRIAPL
ncbi:MAG TPA: amidase [Actinomycetota bacterium]|nr:amidase [Actinomycetota bacterium]